MNDQELIAISSTMERVQQMLSGGHTAIHEAKYLWQENIERYAHYDCPRVQKFKAKLEALEKAFKEVFNNEW